MLKLRPLYYFKTVVEKGSISAASSMLYIAQPPISKALQQLENHWNLTLFERTPRGMIPTDAARYLYQRASDLLLQAQNIDAEMRAFSEGQRGIVRLGCVDMGMGLLAEAIAALRVQHPGLQFSLYQGDPPCLEELLDHRQIDAALTHLPLTLNEQSIGSIPLQPLAIRALCSADGPLAALTSVTLAELAEYPLVLLRRKNGSGLYERIVQRFTLAGLSPDIVAQASDIPVMKQLARQGVAVAVVPSLEDTVPDPRLISLPVPELDAAADRLVLIYHQQHSESAALKPLLAYFLSQ